MILTKADQANGITHDLMARVLAEWVADEQQPDWWLWSIRAETGQDYDFFIEIKHGTRLVVTVWDNKMMPRRVATIASTISSARDFLAQRTNYHPTEAAEAS